MRTAESTVPCAGVTGTLGLGGEYGCRAGLGTADIAVTLMSNARRKEAQDISSSRRRTTVELKKKKTPKMATWAFTI